MSKQIGKLNPNSNQRLIVYSQLHNAPTLQCAMGTGGGQVPLIITEYDKDKVREDKTSDK